jgi:hypothetical protein
MTQDNQFLTTGEFSSQAGIPTSKVPKLIREGKIKAEKKADLRVGRMKKESG